MHKVFISYHHANDQFYNQQLVNLNTSHQVFIDRSVDTGDIDEHLDDEAIRVKIRDEYLRDSTVTILLVGAETRTRKHIDWEIYSSMRDGKINKKSGILVVNLPAAESSFYTATHAGEKETIYPETSDWTTVDSRAEYQRRYPRMPDRIIDNLLEPKATISVVPWNKFESNATALEWLIEAAHADRETCTYNFDRPMRRSN